LKWALTALVLIVIVLHQDFWNWTIKTRILGFVPIGLAYHAAFAVLASVTMALLVRYAWPAHLEDAEGATVVGEAVVEEAGR
jgi:hypothetical protein